MSAPLPPDDPDEPHTPVEAAAAPDDPAEPATTAEPGPAAQPAPAAEPAPAAQPTPAAGPVPPSDLPGPAPTQPSAPPIDEAGYAVPAYAVPSQPAGHVSLPATAAPSAPSPGARYAPPTAYVLPPAGLAAPPHSPPGSPSGVPGAPQQAAAHAYALPPYARTPSSPPPGSTYPGATGSPGGPVYPGSPAYSGAPVAGGPAGGGPDTRPKTLAVVALALAGAGTLLGVLPPLAGGSSALGGIGWVWFLMLFAAFVISLIALISKNQGGKGLGVTALVLSIVGGLVSMIVGLAALFGAFSGPSSSYDDPGSSWEDGDSYDDYGFPGLAAPGTDGEPDAGAEFDPPQQATVTEVAFAPTSDDSWWYAVVIDNPNADYVFDSYFDVRVLAADGTTIETSPEFAALLPGRTVIVGTVYDVVDQEIADIQVDLPEASEATLLPATEIGSFTVDDVAAEPDGHTVTGTVSGHFADDQEFVVVQVLARGADGTIVAAARDYVDAVPGDGTPVGFETWFWDELPPDVTLEASAHR